MSTASSAAPAASKTASSATAVQAAAQPSETPCATQVTDWAATGGGATLPTFASDASAFAQALETLASDMTATGATATDTSDVQSAAASMQSDAQALEASPGPSCVPGLAANVSAAARYYSTAAIDADNAIGQLSAGAMTAAADDMVSANTAITKANAKLAAANNAVKAFTAGNGSAS